MLKLAWDYIAWEDYLYWQKEDKQILKKINNLIKDIIRSPFNGIGKPEQLKTNLYNIWSRRITNEHRITYYVENYTVIILTCRYHYKK